MGKDIKVTCTKLDLGPDDTVLVRVDIEPGEAEMREICMNLKQAYPNNRVVVVDRRVDVEVIRQKIREDETFKAKTVDQPTGKDPHDGQNV